ncbi:MAG TPA: carbon-nitrogen hydrolase family protein [Thermoleophilia bacterium]|nr:carbon-nitrogen hydrolase family protein [Thermoleophilia bacterium]HQG04239.1 carbon-nitrogen hydrolase family protein [Thermoleophilia bacterium]HQJ97625.1 carbon-nitrogen hydrolase family protein [Thermoleophilia bacterium]
MSDAPAEERSSRGADAGGRPLGRTLRVACVQLNTTSDVMANIATASRLVREAAGAGAELIALPETWAFKGHSAGILASAEPIDGPSNAVLAGLAAEHGVHVLAGSHYERTSRADRAFNTSVLFGPKGEVLAVYRKIHLFDAISGTTVYRESDDLVAGDQVVTARIVTGAGVAVTLGLSICYDVRFPELYRALALRGAEVLLVPAAFTHFTGAAHWEVLLRARAIENGCFVVAPDQTGSYLPDHRCYGNSMVVDPWGRVVRRMGEEVGWCLADLDLDAVGRVREQIPSLAGRRPETYGL